MLAMWYRTRVVRPAPRRGRGLSRFLACAAAGAAMTMALPASAAGERYTFRVDLSRRPAEVTASIPVLETKDFAFLTTVSGRDVTDLTVRDSRGTRQVSATGDPGFYQVDGLAAGMVHATYRLPLSPTCGKGSCGDAQGGILDAGDFLLYPMGADPGRGTACRVELILPENWSLVTPRGLTEPIFAAESLATVAATPLLVGDQVASRTPAGEILVVRSTGWTVGAESVAAILSSYLHEQQRLLGARQATDGALLVRVIPVEKPVKTPLTVLSPNLYQLELQGNTQRASMAAGLTNPMAGLYASRLNKGLAGATAPEILWWRTGFTEYTNLLAAVRSHSLPEDRLMNRLLEAWLSVSAGSPLAGSASLATAGTQAASLEAARSFVRDGGLVVCFLIDLRLRHESNGEVTIGDLLAATAGRKLDNNLLMTTGSSLTAADLTDLFGRSVTGTQPPPFPAEATLVGLELVDAGTGQIYAGMSLHESEPVITAIADNGPARNMDMRSGDRIIAVDGNPVSSSKEVMAAIAGHAPGQMVEISVSSGDGQIFTAGLTLWEKVAPTLRRIEGGSLAGANAWSRLTRGEAATFLN